VVSLLICLRNLRFVTELTVCQIYSDAILFLPFVALPSPHPQPCRPPSSRSTPASSPPRTPALEAPDLQMAGLEQLLSLCFHSHRSHFPSRITFLWPTESHKCQFRFTWEFIVRYKRNTGYSQMKVGRPYIYTGAQWVISWLLFT